MANAADGYLGDYAPHKGTCRCTDCQLDRAQDEIRTLRERIKQLEGVGERREMDTKPCCSCGDQTVYSCVYDRMPLCGLVDCREKHEARGECSGVINTAENQ